MSLYRIVVSFFKDHMQYMQERGCLAMTPGQALDDTLTHLNIHMNEVQDFKAWTMIPRSLEEFGYDARHMDCLGAKYTVQDIWTKRFG